MNSIMSIKRKDDDPSNLVDKNELKKLTRVAKAWDFTCSFCFKKFPSAQAMGGHQNAHRSARLEEKRRFVRDPIGYRKRAYLKAMKMAAASSGTGSGSGASNPTPNLHAPSPPEKTANNVTGKGDEGINVGKNNVSVVRLINFFPPSELDLVGSVGLVHAADHAEVDEQLDVGGQDNNLEKLDLTLKL